MAVPYVLFDNEIFVFISTVSQKEIVQIFCIPCPTVLSTLNTYITNINRICNRIFS